MGIGADDGGQAGDEPRSHRAVAVARLAAAQADNRDHTPAKNSLTPAQAAELGTLTLGLRGLTLRDASIIRLMDDGNPPLSMPPLLKSDGDFAQNKPLATLEEMRLLIRHASNVAAHLAESVNTGEIAASPLSFPNEDSPCSKCDAFDICRRNAPNSGIVPRTAEKMKLDELIEKISE